MSREHTRGPIHAQRGANPYTLGLDLDTEAQATVDPEVETTKPRTHLATHAQPKGGTKKGKMKKGYRPIYVRVTMSESAERVVWVPTDERRPEKVQSLAEQAIMVETPAVRLGPGSHAVKWSVSVTNGG